MPTHPASPRTPEQYKVLEMYLVSHGDICYDTGTTPEVAKAQVENFNRFLTEFNCDYYLGIREKCWHATLKQSCMYSKYRKDCDLLPDNDHCTLFKKKDTGELLYVSQPYGICHEDELFDFCEQHGMDCQILPYCWYRPGSTSAFVLSRAYSLSDIHYPRTDIQYPAGVSSSDGTLEASGIRYRVPSLT